MQKDALENSKESSNAVDEDDDSLLLSINTQPDYQTDEQERERKKVAHETSEITYIQPSYVQNRTAKHLPNTAEVGCRENIEGCENSNYLEEHTDVKLMRSPSNSSEILDFDQTCLKNANNAEKRVTNEKGVNVTSMSNKLKRRSNKSRRKNNWKNCDIRPMQSLLNQLGHRINIVSGRFSGLCVEIYFEMEPESNEVLTQSGEKNHLRNEDSWGEIFFEMEPESSEVMTQSEEKSYLPEKDSFDKIFSKRERESSEEMKQSEEKRDLPNDESLNSFAGKISFENEQISRCIYNTPILPRFLEQRNSFSIDSSNATDARNIGLTSSHFSEEGENAVHPEEENNFTTNESRHGEVVTGFKKQNFHGNETEFVERCFENKLPRNDALSDSKIKYFPQSKPNQFGYIVDMSIQVSMIECENMRSPHKSADVLDFVQTCLKTASNTGKQVMSKKGINSTAMQNKLKRRSNKRRWRDNREYRDIRPGTSEFSQLDNQMNTESGHFRCNDGCNVSKDFLLNKGCQTELETPKVTANDNFEDMKKENEEHSPISSRSNIYLQQQMSANETSNSFMLNAEDIIKDAGKTICLEQQKKPSGNSNFTVLDGENLTKDTGKALFLKQQQKLSENEACNLLVLDGEDLKKDAGKKICLEQQQKPSGNESSNSPVLDGEDRAKGAGKKFSSNQDARETFKESIEKLDKKNVEHKSISEGKKRRNVLHYAEHMERDPKEIIFREELGGESREKAYDLVRVLKTKEFTVYNRNKSSIRKYPGSNPETHQHQTLRYLYNRSESQDQYECTIKEDCRSACTSSCSSSESNIQIDENICHRVVKKQVPQSRRPTLNFWKNGTEITKENAELNDIRKSSQASGIRERKFCQDVEVTPRKTRAMIRRGDGERSGSFSISMKEYRNHVSDTDESDNSDITISSEENSKGNISMKWDSGIAEHNFSFANKVPDSDNQVASEVRVTADQVMKMKSPSDKDESISVENKEFADCQKYDNLILILLNDPPIVTIDLECHEEESGKSFAKSVPKVNDQTTDAKSWQDNPDGSKQIVQPKRKKCVRTPSLSLTSKYKHRNSDIKHSLKLQSQVENLGKSRRKREHFCKESPQYSVLNIVRNGDKHGDSDIKQSLKLQVESLGKFRKKWENLYYESPQYSVLNQVCNPSKNVGEQQTMSGSGMEIMNRERTLEAVSSAENQNSVTEVRDFNDIFILMSDPTTLTAASEVAWSLSHENTTKTKEENNVNEVKQSKKGINTLHESKLESEAKHFINSTNFDILKKDLNDKSEDYNVNEASKDYESEVDKLSRLFSKLSVSDSATKNVSESRCQGFCFDSKDFKFCFQPNSSSEIIPFRYEQGPSSSELNFNSKIKTLF